MAKTKIDWADYSINPIKGLCPVDCKDNQGKSYCYARRMYKRFKWYEGIEWDESCLYAIRKIKKPSRIFVGSTMELFGEWVHNWALESIFSYCKDYSQHTFIFLTKKPENLKIWSPFPDNCWVGVSVTSNGGMTLALTNLANIKATVRFISFEPLLGAIGMNDHMSMKGVVDWVIIGQQTPPNKKTIPKIEWVKEIVEAADKVLIPVFLKDNLKPLLKNKEGWTPAWAISARSCDGIEYLRQEFPTGV